MLQNARILKASVICRDGFEVRIGRQLDLATMSDLLIATQGCSKEEKYDTECVRRILKHFHTSLTMKDQSKLAIVVELVKDYLWEAANDINLTKESFLSLAEMLIAESEETEGSSDGIYRAINIYLNKHSDLTESEREEICVVLDCNKMSPEAREEAARNVRLPVRTVLQVLFAEQLKLREMVTKEVKIQLEKSSFRVMELEKECLMLRKELVNESSLLLLELRQLQLPNEEEGSSEVEEDEDIVYFNT
ncbi:phototropic-responsive NPH3 family protein [Artemisia annua]|uniref:Phototropic-responsive NPH3 family protein n=1 Tax=Artemisia annua TaxID=35608 RepID=A0A2U1LY81_ARTAN|nr:phototropic-responsive NPH3 family protein [Artemisia annua]